MLTHEAIARLDDHQQRILDHADHAVACLAEGVAAIPALAHARWKMVRLLREYQVFKHAEIFDPVIRSGTPAQVALATEMRATCLAAGEAYHGHTLRWSCSDIAAGWDEYRSAMLAMKERLRRHLLNERLGVRTILTGAPRTRAAAGGR